MHEQPMVFDDMDEDRQALVREALPPIVVTLDDPEKLASEHARLQALVDDGKLPHIKSVLSIHTLMPTDQTNASRQSPSWSVSSNIPICVSLPPALIQPLLPLRDWKPRVLSADDFHQGLIRMVGEGETHFADPPGESVRYARVAPTSG